MARPTVTSAEIKQSMWELIDTIKYQPTPLGGGLITYNVVKATIFSQLYSPNSYPKLALALDGLLTAT